MWHWIFCSAPINDIIGEYTTFQSKLNYTHTSPQVCRHFPRLSNYFPFSMNWMPVFQLRDQILWQTDCTPYSHNTLCSKISIKNNFFFPNSHTINFHQSIVNLCNLLVSILLLVKIGRESLWSRLETFTLIEKIAEGIFVIVLGFDLAALSSTTPSPRRSGCRLRSAAFPAMKETCKRRVS